MTCEWGRPNVIAMTNQCTRNRFLIALAFSAVISLTIGHLVDLAAQTLSSGPTSTAAVIGDLAGILACLASVLLGLRFYRRV
jgi:hypothetical protein